VLTFSNHDLPIPLPKYENFRTRGGRNLEYTLPELARTGHSGATEQLRDSSRAEFHFRLAEVATMFLLPMLGLALGVPPKRSNSGFGVFFAIVMLVTYHKINEYAAAIGELGRIDPLIALWVPFCIFAGLVIWMYYTIAYVPGGQPIGAIERAFSKMAKAVTSRLPTRRRRERDAEAAA
jgi:lipopolysaccharide export system permease protein